MKPKKERSKSLNLAEDLIVFLLHMVTVVGVIDTLVYEGMRVADRFQHSHVENQPMVNPIIPVPTQVSPTPNSGAGEAENRLTTVVRGNGVPHP